MADLKIKPSAGAGNKLILESQDGTDVLTTSDSGVAITAPTIASMANCTFPAGHVKNIQFGEISDASISNNSFAWGTYLVTVDMTSPTTGNILYALGNTGGHVNANAAWCQTRIYRDDAVNNETVMSQQHASAYFNDNTSYPGGGGSVMGKYVIPSGTGTITVRLLAYVNVSATWSVTGSSLMCWEVQG